MDIKEIVVPTTSLALASFGKYKDDLAVRSNKFK